MCLRWTTRWGGARGIRTVRLSNVRKAVTKLQINQLAPNYGSTAPQAAAQTPEPQIVTEL